MPQHVQLLREIHVVAYELSREHLGELVSNPLLVFCQRPLGFARRQYFALSDFDYFFENAVRSRQSLEVLARRLVGGRRVPMRRDDVALIGMTLGGLSWRDLHEHFGSRPYQPIHLKLCCELTSLDFLQLIYFLSMLKVDRLVLCSGT